MSLTELSYYLRKFLPFGILILLIILILYYLVQLAILSIQPEQKTNISLDPVFGKIKPPILGKTTSSAGLNYTIDTLEGTPITATSSADVYFLPTSPVRFGYREKIYLMAKTLGFDTEVVKHKLEGKEAVFKDENQTLTIDITNFNFTYEYSFENHPDIFEGAQAPDKTISISNAIEFLKTVDRYPAELTQGKTNAILIKYDPALRKIFLTKEELSANMIEIDFYRPDMGSYIVVSPEYYNSQNYVMMVQSSSGYKIVKAQVHFYEKSEAQIGIYPIKTGDAAWQALKTGKGWAIQNPNVLRDVVIKEMFMGYLDPDIYQEYLQPVYVFLGENNFVAYVPAVADEYFIE
ncbi:hypothetical protein A2866_02780 [Candidatus Roizmanbacteria bacterium RIFCSPHIGHO2_01_FULL_39_8]|uniref:Uncharacterized protein n=3 Tax=Candidatus Roizmaniibacteriota TaxID=1752723 RepID=A0A1F7GQ73_9BACT|nr:MAG: hypothetical protein A2866_02780 [Candidatus Roizmanbacteria bacterium RIFCSPHIGHO2_01_FULL_39_8]OGK25476.1 MAG: hypothetical protein A3C28_01015 [Candidatus Roizmanbacteria bacterium RIFCSPHIGHO2_02_FULL_39_9]OGK38036.1 MAG: hypothetical protein A3F60_03350 [Candidatus Roizmanbacteria bacterium RIFCSPHIGHO2_12_FULL_39_8]